MERLKLFFTALSFVLVTLCFAASMYFTFAVPDDGTFRIFDGILGVAMLWFAYNTYVLLKSHGKE